MMNSKYLREIDRLIAIHVFDYKKEELISRFGDNTAFRYTTNIGDAWLIMEKLQLSIAPAMGGWRVAEYYSSLNDQNDNAYEFSFAETISLAICMEALRIKEIEILSESSYI